MLKKNVLILKKEGFMTQNVCGIEKRTRAIIGIILIIIGFIVSETVGLVIGVIGGFLILTAFFSFCPINAMFGRNSCYIAGHRR